jgi:hypothetical protein
VNNVEFLRSLYTIAYHSGLVATVLGCALIIFKTECRPKELFGGRYNHYFQSEISSFISYSGVIAVYLTSFLVLYIYGVASEAFLESSYSAFIRYWIKISLELLLVVYIVTLHSVNLIKHSFLTKVICFCSIFLAFWHCIMMFDDLVFETKVLDKCYSIVIVLITVLVSAAIIINALRFVKAKE